MRRSKKGTGTHSCSSSGATSTESNLTIDHPVLVSIPSTEALDEIGASYQEVARAYKKGDYESIARRHEELVQAEVKLPGNMEPRFAWWCCNAYLHLDKEKDAQAILPKLKTGVLWVTDSELAEAHSAMLNILVIEGQTDPEFQKFALRLAQVLEKPNVAQSLQHDLGVMLLRPNPKEAITYLEACLVVSQKPGEVLSLLADAHVRIGNLDRALAYCLDRVSLVVKNPRELALACHDTAKVYMIRGDPKEAMIMLQRGIDAVPYKNDLHLKLWNALAQLQCQEGDYAACLGTQHGIMNYVEEEYGPQSPHFAKALYAMGRICIKMGDFEQAIGYFQQELKVTKSIFGNNHMEVSRVLHELGKIFDEELGDYEMALSYYQKALMVETACLDRIGKHSSNRTSRDRARHREYSSQVRETKSTLGRLYYKTGDFGSAVRTSFPDSSVTQST